MARFEGYERREAKILAALKEYGISKSIVQNCITYCVYISADNADNQFFLFHFSTSL